MLYRYRNYILTTLVIIALLLFMFELSLMNNVPQYGVDTRKLERDLEELETENAQLKEEIIGLESLKSIEMRSAELGFQEPKYLILK